VLPEELEHFRERLERQERRLEDSIKELNLLKQISTDNLIATIELRRYLETLTREFKEFKDEMKAFKDEMKVFKDEMTAFKNEMKVFKDEMTAFKDEMKVFKDEMTAFKDEMRAFKDEMNRRWGELANRLGTIAEDIFAPGIPYLAERLGLNVIKRMLDVEYRKEGRYNQYDAIVVAEDPSGNEVVLVAEVKSQLRPEHFQEFRSKLENLLYYEPDWQGRNIIPILAAFRIPEDLVGLANRRGVLLVRMEGDYLEPINPEVIDKQGPSGEAQ